MKISFVDNPNDRGPICEKILRALPDWFGIESAIVDYIKDVFSMDTWIASTAEQKIIGFISIKKHNAVTAEIHVMGVMSEYHRSGIGRLLVNEAEKYLALSCFKFLTVKTLSESRPNKEYDQTRQFYLKMGFDPVEEFKTLWDEYNPCLLLIKNIEKSVGSDQKTIDNELFDKLFYLEKRLHSHEVRSNIEELSKLLSAKFCEFGSSGKVWTREDILLRLPTEDGSVKIEATDFKAVKLSENVVLITYKSWRVSSCENSSYFLRGSIWKKYSNSWQMEFHQGTVCKK